MKTIKIENAEVRELAEAREMQIRLDKRRKPSERLAMLPVRKAQVKELSALVDEVAQLEAKIELLQRKYYSALCTKCGYMRPATEIEKENAALKTELRGERERLLTEMYNNDTISQVQFDHAIKELDALIV